MAYGYQPRDPRAKLREIVTKYLSSMRVAGHTPAKGVVFGEDRQAGSPHTYGWLVDDRRPGVDESKFLLFDDGDVWRAKTAPGASPALDAAVEAWMNEPSDDLVMLLARSLQDARMGGGGWLDAGEGVERVDDRRRQQRPHGGRDRRSL